MKKINVLPQEIASKIAAGEVVQRPASVVKELIDNALDAGADRIRIEIEEGGKKRISVSDNGTGMAEEDIQICTERHATSKVSCISDLDAIRTLGFRGEALGSISAVSEFTLVSRGKDSELGTKLRHSDEGTMIEPVGCPQGTSVQVENLFYNVPARKKFLKTTSTEYNAIVDIVVKEALAFQQVHFTIIHNGRKTVDHPQVPSRADRVLQVLGKGLAESIMPFKGRAGPSAIEGFITLPTEHRRNTRLIYFLVNNRCIQDRLLMRTLLDPYRSLIPSGRYPLAVLYLSLPPENVDVNVHPAKTEVRFQQEDLAFRLVRGTVFKTLTEFDGTSLASLDTESDRTLTETHISQLPPQSGRPSTSSKVPTRQVSELEDKIRETVDAFGERVAELERQERQESLQQPLEQQPSQYSKQSPPPPKQPLSDATPEQAGQTETQRLFPSLSKERTEPPAPVSPRAVFGKERKFRAGMQMNNAFIVGQIEGETDLLIIDQHAAHERILFEEFRGCTTRGALPSQNLLIPITWDVAPSEVDSIRDNLERIRKLGFEIEYFGGETFNVTSIPATLDLETSIELLQDSIPDISQASEAEASMQEIQEALLEKLACHSAVRSGQPLRQKEMESLANKLGQTVNAGTCPHGRPTMLRMTESELSRYFNRG